MTDERSEDTAEHSTEPGRLLLGFAGWPHAEWGDSYFPDDLPPDWRFAYYSNDAGCLLLSQAQWQALGVDELEDWLDDVPPFFRFYPEVSTACDLAKLDVLRGRLGALLVADDIAAPGGWPVWRALGDGRWGPLGGAAWLQRWRYDGDDLRQWRQRLQQLPPGGQAIVFEAGDADPRVLPPLRTLTELLGLA